VDRDLQDVLRDLRMGTAQVGSPEQFFALVSPVAAAIRESVEAVPQATEEMRKAANDLREKANELEHWSTEVAQRTKTADDAARAVTSAGREIVGHVSRASERLERSAGRAGAYPQRTFWFVILVAAGSAFWSWRESEKMRRRFDILEHNQLVIADKLGVPLATPTAAPSGSQPAADPRPPVQRKRRRRGRRPGRTELPRIQLV
jgi:hypothetical protein